MHTPTVPRSRNSVGIIVRANFPGEGIYAFLRGVHQRLRARVRIEARARLIIVLSFLERIIEGRFEERITLLSHDVITEMNGPSRMSIN